MRNQEGEFHGESEGLYEEEDGEDVHQEGRPDEKGCREEGLPLLPRQVREVHRRL
jgi:hypothetical protein